MKRLALSSFALTVFTSMPSAQSVAQRGEALAPAAWSARASEQLAQLEYEFAPVAGEGGVWSAPNRAQAFRSRVSGAGLEVFPRETSADGEGAAWKLEITTAALGRAGDTCALLDAQTVRVVGERVELDHGACVEWFENTSAGLEQGWTIGARPLGDGPLWISLDFKGLSLRIDDSARGGVLVDERGEIRLRYEKLLAFDAAGRELDARITADAHGVGIEVDDANALYPLLVDPVLTGPAWTAESDQADVFFGYSVASAGDINGDGYSDVIVGAPNYDDGQIDEGRAFVYHGSASGLSATANWIAEEGDQAFAWFGNAVSTAGDVNGDGFDDVIVGSFVYDNGETDEGAAFVYHGSASGLSTTPNWIGDSDLANATFAQSVSYAGDVNADGYDDVIVGANSYGVGQALEGAAFVYHGSASGLLAAPATTLESNVVGARSGWSVSCAGDVDGDGYADVIVGAPNYANGQSNEGVAWVHRGSAGGVLGAIAWSFEANQNDAWLGYSVSGAGDVNGDGFGDVLVGAPDATNGEFAEGHAWVFHGSSGGLLGAATWTAESNQPSASLGIAVSAAGDVNGDGFGDVIVGAQLYDDGHSNEGSAFLYLGSTAGLDGFASFGPQGDQTNAYLGCAVACAGDVNGDGLSDVVIGSYGFDNGQSNEGRAYVYVGGASGLLSASPWAGEGNQTGALFGLSVGSAGDVNGDGFGDVIVGAPSFDNGESDEGAAFVFLGNTAGLASNAAWMGELNQINAQFGIAVASAGDVNGDGFGDVIVGAPSYDNFQQDEGRVVTYLGSAAGLATSPAWSVESDQAFARLGSAVACAGDLNADGLSDVVVGAKFFDNGQLDEGVALVYSGSATAMSAVPDAMFEVDQPNVLFGSSVASAGDVNGDGFSDLIIGAPQFSGGQSNEGRAFVYLGSEYGASGVPQWAAECDTASALFGCSVASAGDVNSDGYSDVVIGAMQFIGDQHAEGRAFLYLGSSSGLAASAVWTTESDQIYGYLGGSVGGAGDVNGDGFTDAIVGSHNYDNEGRAWVYLGNSGGLLSNTWATDGNQVQAFLGCAVAAAGDVDADGFADVAVGAYGYDNGHTNEGAAFVFYGNEGRGSAVRGAQQRRSDDSAPIALLGRSDSYDSVRLALTLTELPVPASGSDLAWLEWEVKPIDTPLDGTNLGRSAVGQPIAGNLPLAFNELVTGLTSTLPYQWRVRIATDNPLYPYTPWVTQAATGKTAAKFRTLAGVVCPTPLNYCTPSSTTNNCTPVMSSAGTPSFSASSGFTLLATNLEGAKTGLIFYGVNGPHAGVWGTGYLCVKAPTQRTPSQGSGGTANACNGVMSIDWLDYMATHNGAVGHPLLEGKTFWAQCWFRDPPAPKTTNFTDGLSFTLCL